MESALRGFGHFGNDQDEAPVIGKCISLEIYGHFGVPSLKLTRPLKIDHWKRRFLLETTIFRGYVSCRECTPLHHLGATQDLRNIIADLEKQLAAAGARTEARSLLEELQISASAGCLTILPTIKMTCKSLALEVFFCTGRCLVMSKY